MTPDGDKVSPIINEVIAFSKKTAAASASAYLTCIAPRSVQLLPSGGFSNGLDIFNSLLSLFVYLIRELILMPSSAPIL